MKSILANLALLGTSILICVRLARVYPQVARRLWDPILFVILATKITLAGQLFHVDFVLLGTARQIDWEIMTSGYFHFLVIGTLWALAIMGWHKIMGHPALGPKRDFVPLPSKNKSKRAQRISP
jgi:hypothetical protein